MIVSMFSIFDPCACGGVNLLLLFLLIPLILCLPTCYIIGSLSKVWTHSLLKVFLTVPKMMHRRVQLKYGWLMLTLFILISVRGLVGIIPNTYTPSTHPLVPLRLALPLCVSSYTLSIVVSLKGWLCHLIPIGCPTFLRPFIVLVETISILIRPLTLFIRLLANTTAGHLILSLRGSRLSFLNSLVGPLPSFLALQVMETSVVVIQAYVLVSLVSLYLTEVNDLLYRPVV